MLERDRPLSGLQVLVAVATLGLLAACNTVSGAGEDIEAGGRAITDTADDTQREITE